MEMSGVLLFKWNSGVYPEIFRDVISVTKERTQGTHIYQGERHYRTGFIVAFFVLCFYFTIIRSHPTSARKEIQNVVIQEP